MRILMLNYEFPPLGGGAANACYHLLKEFSSKNITVDLVTSSISKFRVEKFSSNITIHYLNIGKKGSLHNQSVFDLLAYSFSAYFYALGLRLKKKYTLCHSFFTVPCGFLGLFLFLPQIVSLRGSDVPFYSRKYVILDTFFFSWLSRIIWFFSKSVIANSRGLATLANFRSVKVIPNGVSLPHFKRRFRKSGHLRILSVGRLIERKGFDKLIKACVGIPCVVTIVGEGPELASLRSLASNLGVTVHFVGLVNHSSIGTYYKNADVFCLLSSNEGMSNTVLEALSYSLPCVVTDVGGTAELVDSSNGFIVTSVIKDTGFALASYDKDRVVLKKHSLASFSRAQKFSWVSVSSSYMDEYKKV